jgi:hypothetical protein
LAEALSLAPERVVIKRVENLDMVSFECDVLTGPEFITPIGIGVTAFEERDQDFIQVNVNETAIRLFNSKPLQVSDALILTGYNARSLISERGDSFSVQVDGDMREIKGDYGEPAQIYINGATAHLDTRINHKDLITVVPAQKGKPRKITLKDIIKLDGKITLNGQAITVIEFVSVNGVNRTGDYMLIDGDIIVTRGIKTVKQLAEAVELDLSSYAIFIGDTRLEPADAVKVGSHYHYKKYEAPIRTEIDRFNQAQSDATNDGAYGDKSVLSVSVNGEPVTIPITKNHMVFVDVFDHIAFDLTKPQGILVLKLNGSRANYTDTLNEGDAIDIYWNN